MTDQTTINLFEKLGWDKLPQEKQEELIEKTGGIIFKKIMARFIEVLDNDDKEEMTQILSEEVVDNDKLLKFIQEKIPNSDELIQEEAGAFMKEADDIMNRK